jgi:hypothetical protein
MARLHELIGQHLGEDGGEAEVVIGIETDRGPWVAALTAAGYTVFAVNPLQGSRYRERHGVSGAKGDAGDAHMPGGHGAHRLPPDAGGPSTSPIPAGTRSNTTNPSRTSAELH